MSWKVFEIHNAEVFRGYQLYRRSQAGEGLIVNEMKVVQVTTDEGVTVTRLQGKLVQSTLTPLKTFFDGLPEQGTAKILMNFRDVNIIDSVAVGFLAAKLKEFQDRGEQLKLCCLRDPIKTLFKVTDLEKHFEIYDTEDKGLEGFSCSDVNG